MLPLENASFSFLDEEIQKFYKEDQKIRNVLGMACALAISCLRLLGLSSYTIAQRTKEISTRKVLGASIPEIPEMISRDYMILLGISFILAVFPAYYFLSEWLAGFQYRVEMPFFLYALSGVGILLICLLIVGLHSYSAAKTNPAKVLKSE